MNSDNQELFQNLRALEGAAFPKACKKCGQRYQNEREYIEKTSRYHDVPSFTESASEDGKTYLKLVRQCVCGEPILDHFGDRRDMTRKGELKRQAFEKVILSLQSHGLDRTQARKELLNHLNNRKSPLLEKLGIFNR